MLEFDWRLAIEFDSVFECRSSPALLRLVLVTSKSLSGIFQFIRFVFHFFVFVLCFIIQHQNIK